MREPQPQPAVSVPFKDTLNRPRNLLPFVILCMGRGSAYASRKPWKRHVNDRTQGPSAMWRLLKSTAPFQQPSRLNLAPLRRLRSLRRVAVQTASPAQLKLVKRSFRHVSETEAASSPLVPNSIAVIRH